MECTLSNAEGLFKRKVPPGYNDRLYWCRKQRDWDVSRAFAWKQRHLRSSLYADPRSPIIRYCSIQTHILLGIVLPWPRPFLHRRITILIYSGINSGNIDFCQGNIGHCSPVYIVSVPVCVCVTYTCEWWLG